MRNRVLLIHPNSAVAETRAALLERSGYSVAVCSSSSHAALLASAFDLVVVDSERDHQQAIRFCEELKRESPGTRVALVAWWNKPVQSTCPDDVIDREQGPQGFLSTVQSLLPPPQVRA